MPGALAARVVGRVGVVVRGDGVGQRRQRRAGGDAHGLAGLQAVRLPGPDRDLAHHGQLDGLLGRGAHVDAAHGEAVDGRLVEPGQRPVGDDLLGAQQTLRGGDVDPDRRGADRGVEHTAQLGLDRPHRLRLPSGRLLMCLIVLRRASGGRLRRARYRGTGPAPRW